MALSFCVLASGSSGNCTLVAAAGRHLLIDAGLPPRAVVRHLRRRGLRLDDIETVLLTHADADHLRPGWSKVAEHRPITWRVHERHYRRALRLGLPVGRVEPFGDDFDLDGATRVEPVLLPHDALGSSGYVIDHGGARLGYATDFGRVTRGFADRFRDLHALAIESNYDRSMQVRSGRPDFLKRRIMGGLGHLSNEQALDAVIETDQRSDLQHVTLLHLSRDCNDPELVLGLYRRRAPHLVGRLAISGPDRPTATLEVRPGRRADQLTFAGF